MTKRAKKISKKKTGKRTIKVAKKSRKTIQKSRKTLQRAHKTIQKTAKPRKKVSKLLRAKLEWIDDIRLSAHNGAPLDDALIRALRSVPLDTLRLLREGFLACYDEGVNQAFKMFEHTDRLKGSN